MNDCNLPKEGAEKGKEFYGVHTMHEDAERLWGWDLLTHGGFLTYPHHDAEGLCTYIMVLSGTKIWGYFNMGTHYTATRKELFNAWDDILLFDQAMDSEKYPPGVVLLKKGNTLIQPPGAPHMVYTPQNSLTSGGHFLSYSTVHLTELAVAYDCSKCPGEDGEQELAATNAAHPSLYRYIIWMILMLPKFASDQAKKYNSTEVMKQMPGTTDVQRDIMAWEVQAEIVKAKQIIAKLKNGLGVTDVAITLEEGCWSDPWPACNIKKIFK
ncbi:hypothetical protein EDC04DRAFT_2601068 [Pisolithus marmoratus]|nr:hypothetical protein EDC04DRAFT_2601068 [Pisolithus marmoratus]